MSPNETLLAKVQAGREADQQAINEARAALANDDQLVPRNLREDALRAAIQRAQNNELARQIIAEPLLAERPKMIQPFAEKFSEILAAVKMSDPSLTLEQAHDRAFAKAKREAATHTFTMAAPTDPTPAKPSTQGLVDGVDGALLESAVDYARQHARDTAPRPPKPDLTANYQAAIKLIAQSPDMTREAALKLARDAQKKDREIQIAREAAVANPPAPGNSGEVRA